jgi:hypothetical protein
VRQGKRTTQENTTQNTHRTGSPHFSWADAYEGAIEPYSQPKQKKSKQFGGNG